MPKASAWTPERDAELTRLYVKEMVAVGQIARRMKASDHNVRHRIAHLKLDRSLEAFQVRWDARREAAKAAVAAARDAYVPPIANKDEQHWRLCRDLGGFNVLIISYPPRRAA